MASRRQETSAARTIRSAAQLLLASGVLAALTPAYALTAAQCAAVKNVSVPATTITSAALVAAAPGVPEYCLVQGRVDTEIAFNLGLPSNWNGKFYHAGGGGFVGSIPSINGGLARGYASVATNTGHVGAGVAALDGSWALNNLERQVNFGHRGIHVVTVAAKQVATLAYGSAPKYAYFEGCSNGGRQALNEAQRYPHDFDGIIAAAPALDWTGLMTGFVWNSKALRAAPIPAAKLTLIAKAAVQRCDANDGLVDGLIDNPLKCDFDPASLQCTGADAPNCLTAAQVGAVKKVYAGPRNSRGKQLHPGFPPGAEGGDTAGTGAGSGWQTWISGPSIALPPVNGNPLQFTFSDHYMKYFVFGNPNYDAVASFDFDRDPRALRETGKFINADNTDLSAFRKGGGKLLLWHGWADHALPQEGGSLHAPVPRARHAPLLGRPRAERVRHADTAGEVGGRRCVTRVGGRDQVRQQRSRGPRRRTHPSAVRVPESRALCRQRQYRFGGEFRVPQAAERWSR
jgi:Tannase and feruloyl esterase